MNVLFLVLCFLVQPESDQLVPIYKVARVDPARWETVYVLSEKKADELAESENYKNIGLIGYGSSEPGEGKTRLFQAYRDGWHVYYTKIPRGETFPKGTKLIEFPIWVWEKPGEGLIPVYAVSSQDWRNIRYYTDPDEAKNALQVTKDAKGIKLKNHGIVFYLKPSEQVKESTEPKTEE